MDWTKPLHDARPMCFDCHLVLAGDCRGKWGGLRRRDAGCRPSGWRRWLVSADGIGVLLDH
jgi:hypothetical protein